MINRKHYIDQIRPFYDSDLIKVITGIRRSGKSVIMEQIIKELTLQGKQILALNFEDRFTSSEITNDLELISYIEKHIGHQKLYVFLDEVQMVKNWNLACRTLRLKNISLFVTGSNSKLLSKEFTKELSGRYVAFCIRPFVYKELTQYAQQLGKEYTINDYLVYGGFPKILEFPDKASILRYLNDLDDTIVINDILNRYRVQKKDLFKKLVNYILISNSRIFSANAVLKYLKNQKLQCSLTTLIKYINYLEEAYVIRHIPQFSTKAKRELSFYEKLYNEDIAFNSIRQPGGRYDVTHNLENIVYNELVYMGYELSVFNSDGKEIDFLAEKNGLQYLVQVAYSIVEESTYKREFELFNKLDNSKAKIIITNDEFDYSTSTVHHIKLKDFLRMNSLEEK